MRIYVDSADIDEIAEALASGYVYGVTTNPTLLRRAGVRIEAVPTLARAAIERGARELHLQVYADDTAGMLREAASLAELDPERVAVKLPATPQGYAAASQLVAQGFRVTLTAVYTVRQAILAIIESSAKLTASTPNPTDSVPTLQGHKSFAFESIRGTGPLPARTGTDRRPNSCAANTVWFPSMTTYWP